MTRHWEKVLLHSGHVGDSLKMKKEKVVIKKIDKISLKILNGNTLQHEI
jgi:hypothetical protein